MKIQTKLTIACVVGISTLAASGAVVVSDDFDSYTDTTFLLASDGTTVLVADGSGGNALQYSDTTPVAGGFFADGFVWEPIVQPGPSGPNTSTDLADYTLSFDITFTSVYIPANGVEIWTADGPRFASPSNNANLYGAGGFATGVPQTVSFTLENPITTTPSGYDGGAFSPTTDTWQFRFNMLDFGSPADTPVSFTIDNFSVDVIPEPSSAALALGALGLAALRRRR